MYLSLSERDGVKFVATETVVSGKLHQALKNKQNRNFKEKAINKEKTILLANSKSNKASTVLLSKLCNVK